MELVVLREMLVETTDFWRFLHLWVGYTLYIYSVFIPLVFNALL